MKHSLAPIASLPAYKSPFLDWDQHASVRNSPIRELHAQVEQGHVFFPTDLVPAFHHPLVVQAGRTVQEAILAHHLVSYLRFTEVLEHKLVNDVTFELSNDAYGLALSQLMRKDARKIYADEAYHNMFSGDLADQVIEVAGIDRVALPRHSFFKTLDEISVETICPHTRRFVPLIATIVSETLISGTLVKVPRDKMVVPTVRAVINDHAIDEGRHHRYFASILEHLSYHLPLKMCLELASLIPHFITAFLTPDLSVVKSWLRKVGMNDQQADQIIGDSYSEAGTLAGIQAAAGATINHCHRCGLMDHNQVTDSFAKAGLIV